MRKNANAACLVGWPVKHSRSPLMHGYWMKRYGIDGSYGTESIPPESFADFIASLRTRGYLGCNVTIPHKEMALALTQPDARASAVGASNTLWFEGDVLRSTNSDVEGFLASLDVGAPGWIATSESAAVLGAGGASRAVVYGLIERGVKRIFVINRNLERVATLRERFGEVVLPASWDDLPGILPQVGLLVNATSLGMHGQPDLVIDLAPLPPHAVVSDIVYVPLETSLLRAAKQRGLRTADGLDMLLFQGARPFQLWFGIAPEVTPELRGLIAADLAKN
jgi:shikimate dehydrogenase